MRRLNQSISCAIMYCIVLYCIVSYFMYVCMYVCMLYVASQINEFVTSCMQEMAAAVCSTKLILVRVNTS